MAPKRSGPRRASAGRVVLVGAGPGDPGLITVRGRALLERADVVVMDALVGRELVRGLRARVINVGKRGPAAPHGAGGATQDRINRLLIRLAREGRFVVRLKGGDPFMFGRGNEEVEALARAGFPCEVVPGISSALAAPASAGISITDRRFASQATVITGHEGKSEKGPDGVDWKRLSPRGTLVVLMGVSAWPRLRRKLAAAGWPADTPVAAVENGTIPGQRVLRARLGDSVRRFKAAHLHSPAVIVLGRVASIEAASRGPLSGRSIVVTRTSERSAALIEGLARLGAHAVACPVIRAEPAPRGPAVRRAREALRRGACDGVVFLSPVGVARAAEVFALEAAALRALPALAVGPATARAARAAGWRVRPLAPVFNARALARGLRGTPGKRWLLPRVEDGPGDVVQALRARGDDVLEVPVYRTVLVRPDAATRERVLAGVDAVLFTSASTVRGFARAFSRAEIARIFDRARAVAIGPTTAAEVRRRLVRPVTARKATLDGLIDAVRRALTL